MIEVEKPWAVEKLFILIVKLQTGFCLWLLLSEKYLENSSWKFYFRELKAALEAAMAHKSEREQAQWSTF